MRPPSHCLAVATLFFCVFAVFPARAVPPPDAAEAMRKGHIAIEKGDSISAIRLFDGARKIAPDDSLIYYNLGAAESRVRGRELRAIVWLAAFLADNPMASNAPAVLDQIKTLDERNKNDLSHLLQISEGILDHVPRGDWDKPSADLAGHWADLGDIASALRIANNIQKEGIKDLVIGDIADKQSEAGDTKGALATIQGIHDPFKKCIPYILIATYQVINGELQQAQDLAARDPDHCKDQILFGTALGLIRNGSTDDARKTAAGIQSETSKEQAEKFISQGYSADNGTPFSGAHDWATMNDIDPLDKPIAMDLGDYIKTLPYTDPEKIFFAVLKTFSTIIDTRKKILAMLKRQMNPSPTLAALREKAEGGDPGAQYGLGKLFNDGQKCYDAARWFLRSAKQGNSEARTSLADLFYPERNCMDADAETVAWFRKDAEQGVSDAQVLLAHFLDEGTGVSKDQVEAVKWYRKAAEQGDRQAEYDLGVHYDKGLGVKLDHAEAYFWLSLAAESEDVDEEDEFGNAGEARDDAARHLTAKQISAQQKRVKEWKPVSAPSPQQ